MKTKTEIKSSSFTVPKFIIYSVKFLELISSKLALKFALKLFFTPLKIKRPQRELKLFNEAIRHKMNTPTSPFTLLEWKSSGPKIIILHGWSGRGTQFVKLIDALRAKNFHVFAIEAPGHGEFKSKSSNMLEFVLSAVASDEKFGPFDQAIGHSLGGMALFNTYGRGMALKAISIIGTPSSVVNVVNEFSDRIGGSKRLVQGIVKYIEVTFKQDISEFATETIANRFKPQGQIIHDHLDNDVSFKEALEMKEAWTEAHLIETEGLGHRRIMKDDEVIDKILTFHLEQSGNS